MGCSNSLEVPTRGDQVWSGVWFAPARRKWASLVLGARRVGPSGRTGDGIVVVSLREFIYRILVFERRTLFVILSLREFYVDLEWYAMIFWS